MAVAIGLDAKDEGCVRGMRSLGGTERDSMYHVLAWIFLM